MVASSRPMTREGTRSRAPGMDRSVDPERVGYTPAVRPPGMPAARGWFITIEGPEGAGKTTQADAARAPISTDAGIAVLLTREPGGTWLGERIRELLLARTGAAAPTDPLTDALLFNAARRQLVEEVIRPALDARRPRWSARASPTRRWPTRATARASRSSDLRALETLATDGLAPGPDDPARPAGRGRPRRARRPAT